MGVFDWSAPLFAAFGNRWSDARIREIADLLGVGASTHPRILDLGGGTGVLAARLADIMPADYCVLDATPAMARYVPGRPDVSVVIGRAEDMPFPDAAFDAVVVSDAFHHFPDQDGAVREIARVLRPEGRLVMFEFDRRAWPVAFAERIIDRRGHLFTPDELCAYLSERGIDGSCRSTSRTAFEFVGNTRPTGS
jgi:demethylmenaquinone methyltransferase/2-methoxy-6-polyprenyl-1,4-benzoquinol methylase